MALFEGELDIQTLN